MNDPVHDGVCDGLFSDGLVPKFHRNLRSDDGRTGVVTVVDNVHQQPAGHIVEWAQGEIVQDQQVCPLDALQVPENLPGSLRRLQQPHQPGGVRIDDPVVLLAGAVAQSRGDEGLSRAGTSGDEDVLFLLDERKIGKPFHKVLVQAPLHRIVHLFHGGGEAEARCLDQVVHVPVVPLVPLVAGQHVHELVDGHVAPAVVLQACFESVVHPVELHLLELLEGVSVHFDFHDINLLRIVLFSPDVLMFRDGRDLVVLRLLLVQDDILLPVGQDLLDGLVAVVAEHESQPARLD